MAISLQAKVDIAFLKKLYLLYEKRKKETNKPEKAN